MRQGSLCLTTTWPRNGFILLRARASKKGFKCQIISLWSGFWNINFCCKRMQLLQIYDCIWSWTVWYFGFILLNITTICFSFSWVIEKNSFVPWVSEKLCLSNELYRVHSIHDSRLWNLLSFMIWNWVYMEIVWIFTLICCTLYFSWPILVVFGH